MHNQNYQTYHQSFMTNNRGTTAVHTLFAILYSLVCILIYSVMHKISGNSEQHIFIEYIVIVLPMILAHTILSSYIYYLNIILFIILMVILIKQYDKLKILDQLYKPNIFKNNRLWSVSCFRGMTFIITSFCILGVDFHIFPRFLAKTERYGYSLMDTGVGLYVLVSGLVHNTSGRGFINIILDNMKMSSMLLLLGSARYCSLKMLQYPTQVSEYGVHWNFFYTLAISKFTSSILIFLVNSKYYLILSIMVGLVHESLLNSGVKQWVYSDAPRDTFINANREGISSCLGFVSMYIFALYLKNKLNEKSVLKVHVVTRLILMCIMLWFMSYVYNIYNPTARPLANLSYCLYLEALLTTVIFVFYIFEAIFEFNDLSVPLIIASVNHNGLLYFLFTNILTGIINLCIRTFEVTTYKSLMLINIYMLVSILFVTYLKQRHINI